MAFARLAFFPHGTSEQHAALVAEVGEAARSPEGRLFFTAGRAPGGWQTVQVWSSFEALEAFDAEVFLPALDRIGEHGFPDLPHVVDFETNDLRVTPARAADGGDPPPPR